MKAAGSRALIFMAPLSLGSPPILPLRSWWCAQHSIAQRCEHHARGAHCLGEVREANRDSVGDDALHCADELVDVSVGHRTHVHKRLGVVGNLHTHALASRSFLYQAVRACVPACLLATRT